MSPILSLRAISCERACHFERMCAAFHLAGAGDERERQVIAEFDLADADGRARRRAAFRRHEILRGNRAACDRLQFRDQFQRRVGLAALDLREMRNRAIGGLGEIVEGLLVAFAPARERVIGFHALF